MKKLFAGLVGGALVIAPAAAPLPATASPTCTSSGPQVYCSMAYARQIAASRLILGERGASVLLLQRSLLAIGEGTVKLTGIFDITTQNALRNYQYTRRLTATGVLDGTTKNYLVAGAGNYRPSAIYLAATVDFTTSQVSAAMVPRTYHAGCPVTPAQLTRLSMNYYGFDGAVHRGYLIVNTRYVTNFKKVFTTVFTTRFPIRTMQDPSVYGSSTTDDASMAADNSYAFFCRHVGGRTTGYSNHSYGRAVDLNTVENPYHAPNGSWEPAAGLPYVNRGTVRPGMLTPASPVTKAFLANGFRWLSPFDYQHFEIR